ncbi:hypothetical protein F4776DRAFT_665941 [Hypoxylon sp. NC0597]|nr:hypothetical protein F4776DRAFT_665941 [Hypoxylon sp. NC0597]
MPRTERLIEEYEMTQRHRAAQESEAAPPPPPPYSSEPERIKPWQIRWNREWLRDGLINDYRKSYARLERVYRTGRAAVLDAIRNGGTDESNTLSRSRWQRIKERLLGILLDDYEAFKEWRKERKERDKVWKVTTVMEDTGDNPEWQAVMTFKITPEHWSEMENAGRWFEFPSTENIKWFWVTGPGYEHLCPPSLQHWDRVLRNAPSGNLPGEYWPNFIEPTSRASCA